MMWNRLKRRTSAAALTPPSALVRAAAALVTCDTLEGLRASVAGALVGSLNCQTVLLFEPISESTDFFVTWCEQERADRGGLMFPRESDLLRWLTVNDAPLRLGTGRHLWHAWSPQDRDVCTRVAAEMAVPFVADDELAAVALVVGLAGSPSAASEAAVQEFAQHVAAQWRQLAAAEHAAAHARSLRRAHELGSVGMLAATLAHEIRNPLAAIRSMVQFVRDAGPDPDEQRRYLSSVMREVDRVDGSVRRTLDLSKPSHDRCGPVDVIALAHDVVRFVAPYAAKRRVELRFEPLPDGLWALGDVGSLRQVLLNVLINACQACAAHGRVSIEVQSALVDEDGREGVRLEVADTGVGLAPDQLASVFEAFYTTKADGTGLGLTFCRDTVVRMDGTIEMRSALGLGSSVIIVLPASPRADG